MNDLKEIRFAVVGCGGRGSGLTTSVLVNLEGVTVAGVCDLYTDKAEKLADKILAETGARPAVYENYHTLFAELKPDAVLVSSSWENHVEVAVCAMEAGIPVAQEVSGAYCEGECRALIAAYEKTKTPFMFMENCCFNKDELLATSLVRNGKFGEVVYCHGAYAHDLRDEVAYGDVNRHYRLRNYTMRNCDNYPTHELGPIARLLNITRGNRMVSLTSRSSKAAGLHAYIQKHSELASMKDRIFAQGDIVETLISCENGELISLKLDTTLPRFYSREFSVRGTEGLYDQNADMVLIDGEFKEGDFDTADILYDNTHNARAFDAYLPAIWQNTDKELLERGHGGMDWFEFVAFVDALRAGEPMPIDVYDATAWMAITYLSAESLAKGGAPVEIPDFTNGAYKTRKPADVVPLPHIDK